MKNKPKYKKEDLTKIQA